MSFVPMHHLAREWDARFNVPTQENLNDLIQNIKEESANSKFKYCHVGGLEVGDKEFQNDFGIQHVHIAFIFNNRVSKSSILKNLRISQGLGYYLVPRNQELPYSGWIKHHTKPQTKVDSDILSLYQYGELPTDKPGVTGFVKRSDEEKKKRRGEVLLEMRSLIETGVKDYDIMTRFPSEWVSSGAKLKMMCHQKRDFFKSSGHPHIWLYGRPGEGKSAVMPVIYPDYYNKNMDTRFFDKYDPDVHSHVLMQDVDHNNIERLGPQFFKSICDETGYPVDRKYLAVDMSRLCVLVTSNFRIHDVLPEDMLGRNEQLTAMRRRFFEVNIRDLLPVLGLKLINSYELKQLKRQGNNDPRKLFIAWDYLRDSPTGEPLQEPEVYQELIKDKYYGKAGAEPKKQKVDQ